MFTTKWRFWLGVGVSAGLLLLLVYRVDLEEVVAALGEADYVYVAPAIALYFLAVYFRAVRWQYLLSPLRAFPVGRLYPVVVIGYMANNLLPARLGELVRSYYLGQRERISSSAALATVVVERVYDGITLLAVAAVAGPVLLLLGEFGGTGYVPRSIIGVLAGLIVAAILVSLALFTLVTTSPRVQAFIQWGIGVAPARLRPRVEEMVRSFIQGLSILKSARRHLGVFLLSLPVWLLEGAMYLLIIYSFGIDDSFGSVGVLVLVVALLTATSNLATALPTSVGGIGPFEVVAQQTLVALGVGASVAAAYAGFLHLVALWLPVNLVGLVLMWKHSLSWRQFQEARSFRGRTAVAGYPDGVPSVEEEQP